MENQIPLGIGSYYGGVYAFEKDGNFFILAEDWRDDDIKEISEEFFRAIEKEFK